jgi:hypothetical protein
MPDEFHDILALPLAFLFFFNLFYQQLFGLANCIQVLTNDMNFGQNVAVLLFHQQIKVRCSPVVSLVDA